jgi:hypothetical protein
MEVSFPLWCVIHIAVSGSWQMSQIYDFNIQLDVQLKLFRKFYMDLCLKVWLDERNTRNLKTGRIVKPGHCLPSNFCRVRKIAKSDYWLRHVYHLFVRMEHLGSHWTGFQEVLHLVIFKKSDGKIQI